MTTPTHFLGGYLALSLSKRLWHSESLSQRTSRSLLVYGLILSLAIDLDVLITKGITDHHKQLPHFPLFWLFVFILLFLVGLLSRRQSIRSLAIVTLVASGTHLLLDLVGVTMGIHLLWPLSMKEFSFTPLKTDFPNEQERLAYIFRSPIVWVGDSIVSFAGLLKMISDFSKRSIK